MAYAGQLRDTKDIDLYIKCEQREAMIQVLQEAGWTDYYDRLPYDRNWIFRSCRGDAILDVMWAMANQRAQVDDEWLNGPIAIVRNVTFRLLRPEETLWSKLYVLQRDRCDWPDAMSMLYSIGPELDWEHLLWRMEEDTPLLAGLIATFRWIAPDTCRQFPPRLWQKLGLTEPSEQESTQSEYRAKLLDGRPWFTPTLDEGRRL